ncbi:hypothetical protein F0562_013672 [Nyssa sinensis]|uniref:Pentatricopeptide repeat-containing protein n=1 Tax=Nyssa sinensis TaxID=561372 RepID=A0A5J4ZKV0_9ASTE|nr:hypothetical protein F0562_013672 [Nyssa sinensis]
MARKLFDAEEIYNKDVVTWNSMISAYSKHGDWFQCFNLYNQMKEEKLRPDCVTFLGLLTACVNSGSVEEGWECFKEMTETYDCQPNQEHYACMVDLLGRAGHMKEASELINSMPFKPDARVWGPLLSACKMHSETKLAEFAAEKLMSMEPKNAGNYVLLSNIYAGAENLELEIKEIRHKFRKTALNAKSVVESVNNTCSSKWVEGRCRCDFLANVSWQHPFWHFISSPKDGVIYHRAFKVSFSDISKVTPSLPDSIPPDFLLTHSRIDGFTLSEMIHFLKNKRKGRMP